MEEACVDMQETNTKQETSSECLKTFLSTIVIRYVCVNQNQPEFTVKYLTQNPKLLRNIENKLKNR